MEVHEDIDGYTLTQHNAVLDGNNTQFYLFGILIQNLS